MITGGAGHVEAIHLLNNMISLVMVALNNSLEKTIMLIGQCYNFRRVDIRIIISLSQSGVVSCRNEILLVVGRSLKTVTYTGYYTFSLIKKSRGSQSMVVPFYSAVLNVWFFLCEVTSLSQDAYGGTRHNFWCQGSGNKTNIQGNRQFSS